MPLDTRELVNFLRCQADSRDLLIKLLRDADDNSLGWDEFLVNLNNWMGFKVTWTDFQDYMTKMVTSSGAKPKSWRTIQRILCLQIQLCSMRARNTYQYPVPQTGETMWVYRAACTGWSPYYHRRQITTNGKKVNDIYGFLMKRHDPDMFTHYDEIVHAWFVDYKGDFSTIQRSPMKE